MHVNLVDLVSVSITIGQAAVDLLDVSLPVVNLTVGLTVVLAITGLTEDLAKDLVGWVLVHRVDHPAVHRAIYLAAIDLLDLTAMDLSVDVMDLPDVYLVS